MADKFFFNVQAVVRQGKRLVQGQLRQFPDKAAAEKMGEQLSTRVAGVVVFSIRGDAENDIWGEPEMIASYGEVPGLEV